MFSKRHVSVLIPSLLLPALAFARPPVPFGGWSVANGVVDTTTSCTTTGVSCKTVATDNGFQYEEVSVTLSTQERYSFLRLIVTDPSATGIPNRGAAPGTLAFANETFTPFAVGSAAGSNQLPGFGVVQGVASKQTITDTADNFKLDTEVQKGNMRTLNATSPDDMFTTNIEQSLGNAEMDSSFKFRNYTQFAMQFPSSGPDSDREIGRKLDISERVAIGEPGATDKNQRFVQSQRAGYAGNSAITFQFGQGAPQGLPNAFLYPAGAGGAYFANAPISTAGSMTVPTTQNGGRTGTTQTVSWAAGDDIRVSWIAQNENATGTITNTTPPSNLIGLNFESVTRVPVNSTVSTTVSAAVIDVPAPANPFDWNTANFGPAPTLP